MSSTFVLTYGHASMDLNFDLTFQTKRSIQQQLSGNANSYTEMTVNAALSAQTLKKNSDNVPKNEVPSHDESRHQQMLLLSEIVASSRNFGRWTRIVGQFLTNVYVEEEAMKLQTSWRQQGKQPQRQPFSSLSSTPSSSPLSTIRGLLVYGPSGCGQREIVAQALDRLMKTKLRHHNRDDVKNRDGGEHLPFTILCNQPLFFNGIEVADENSEIEGGDAKNHHKPSSPSSLLPFSPASSEMDAARRAFLQAACDDLTEQWELSRRFSAVSITSDPPSLAAAATTADAVAASAATATTVVLVPIFIASVEHVFPADDDLIARTNLERLGRLARGVRHIAPSLASPSSSSQHNPTSPTEKRKDFGPAAAGKSNQGQSGSAGSKGNTANSSTPPQTTQPPTTLCPFVIAYFSEEEKMSVGEGGDAMSPPSSSKANSKGKINRLALSSLFSDGILRFEDDDVDAGADDNKDSPSAPSSSSSRCSFLKAYPTGQLEIELPSVADRADILKKTMLSEFARYCSLCRFDTGNINNDCCDADMATKMMKNMSESALNATADIATIISRFLVAANTERTIAEGVKEARGVWDHVLRLAGDEATQQREKGHQKGQDKSTPLALLLETALVTYLNETLLGKKKNSTLSDSTARPSPSSSSLLVKSVTWDDIGGLDEVKQRMRDALIRPRLFPESYKRFNVTPPKGVLLYGPPGCAKTTLVKALCSEGLYSFLYVDCASVLSSYVGESEQYLRDVFAKARSQAPCIVFFDEVEAVSGKREKGSGGGGGGGESDTAKLLSTLLIEMDGFSTGEGASSAAAADVCFVGATNLPHHVDSALLRPGRFDLLIHVPLPTAEERYGILRAIVLKHYTNHQSRRHNPSSSCCNTTPLIMISSSTLDHGVDLRDILGAWLPPKHGDCAAIIAAATKERNRDEEDGGRNVSDAAEGDADHDDDEDEEDDDADDIDGPDGFLANPLYAAAKRLLTITDTLFDGYSGADIASVVKEACTLAQRRHQEKDSVPQKVAAAVEDNGEASLLPFPPAASASLSLLLSLVDLQDAAVASNATLYDSKAIEAFAASH